MSKFTVREGQQVANPEGGVHAAGDSVEMADDEARDLVRAGVLDDTSGVFAEEEWAGQVTDSSGRVVGSEGEAAAPTGERGGGTVQSAGAEEERAADEAPSSSSSSSSTSTGRRSSSSK